MIDLLFSHGFPSLSEVGYLSHQIPIITSFISIQMSLSLSSLFHPIFSPAPLGWKGIRQ